MPISSWSARTQREGEFVADKLRTRSVRRNTVVCLLASMAGVGWLYVLFASGLFLITRIEMDGASSVDRGEVEVMTYEIMDEQGSWPWLKRNMLTVDTKRIVKELQDAFFLENVAVDKKYPNILRLTIQERKSSLVLLTQNRFYELDRRGFITHELTGELLKPVLDRLDTPPSDIRHDISILKIRDPLRLAVGEQYVPEDRMRVWLETYDMLQEQGFGYRNAALESTTSTKLVLNLFEPYEVYFDLLEPLEPQISSYFTFMKFKDPGTRIYSYVDARIPGKIFYK